MGTQSLAETSSVPEKVGSTREAHDITESRVVCVIASYTGLRFFSIIPCACTGNCQHAFQFQTKFCAVRQCPPFMSIYIYILLPIYVSLPADASMIAV